MLTTLGQRKRLQAEQSYLEFIRQAWHLVEPAIEFVENWHIEVICEHIEELIFGHRIKNILCNVPPATMKSLCWSVFLVPWVWSIDPTKRFLYASYDQALSGRDSIASRKIIKSEWYQLRWGYKFSLEKDQQSQTIYSNDRKGWRFSTSVSGGATGRHSDVVIADDIHRVREMESQADREAVVNWWFGTIPTRGRTRDVRRAVVGQRVHYDDLPAHICMKNGGDPIVIRDTSEWDHIRLPMRYEGQDGMPPTKLGFTDPRTEDGELLWDALLPEKIVAELERDLASVGPDVPAGQLQQRPTRRGGSLIRREWFEIVDAAPAKVEMRVRHWDKAATQGGNAYTAGLKMSLCKGVFYIEDVVRAQVGPDGRHEMQKQVATLDAAEDETITQNIEMEGGSAGKDAALFEVRMLAGLRVQITRPTGSKEIRCGPFVSQAKAGNVKLVRGAWNEDLLKELEQFPLGKYKDQADCCSGAFMFLTGGAFWRMPDNLVASGETGDDVPFDAEEMDDLTEFSGLLADIVGGAMNGYEE